MATTSNSMWLSPPALAKSAINSSSKGTRFMPRVCAANLDNLARREVKPTLKAADVPWHGWYALRRGIGTQITAQSKDPLAAKGMLRHDNVATTEAHYIKDVPENTRHAMQAVEQRIQALVVKRHEEQVSAREAIPVAKQ